MPAPSARHSEVFFVSALFTGAAALTGTGSSTTAGIIKYTGAASPTGTGTMTAAGTVKRIGAAALTGTGSNTTAGVVGRTGSVALTATSSLSASSVGAKIGAAALTATSSLTALGGKPPTTATATLTGTGTLTADGYQTSPPPPPPPGTRYAIHWFWEPGRMSEQPDPPKTCPQCGSPVVLMGLDGEVITRHYELAATKPDGNIVEADCPYIATINDSNYAQPLAADIEAGYVTDSLDGITEEPMPAKPPTPTPAKPANTATTITIDQAIVFKALTRAMKEHTP